MHFFYVFDIFSKDRRNVSLFTSLEYFAVCSSFSFVLIAIF